MRHVLFRVDKGLYAVQLAAVREVVPAPPVFTLVPRAPTAVKGVINLRGRVVTVLELSALLGVTSSTGAQLLLLDRGRRELGLLVSYVEGIEELEKFAPPPTKASSAVKGVARLGAQAVTVLDPEGIDAAVAAAFNRS
jgi:purine-binding chemotaxis protein CheW